MNEKKGLRKHNIHQIKIIVQTNKIIEQNEK